MAVRKHPKNESEVERLSRLGLELRARYAALGLLLDEPVSVQLSESWRRKEADAGERLQDALTALTEMRSTTLAGLLTKARIAAEISDPEVISMSVAMSVLEDLQAMGPSNGDDDEGFLDEQIRVVEAGKLKK